MAVWVDIILNMPWANLCMPLSVLYMWVKYTVSTECAACYNSLPLLYFYRSPGQAFVFVVFVDWDKVSVLPRVLDHWLLHPPIVRSTNLSPLRQCSFCQLLSFGANTCRVCVSWNPWGPGCLRCLGRNQRGNYRTMLVKHKPLNVSSVNHGPTQCLLSVPSSSSQTAF